MPNSADLFLAPAPVAPDGRLPEFYAAAGQDEAERLKLMAQFADAVSMQAIAESSARLGATTVLDVGSGASTSLGELVRGRDDTYIPVDGKSDYVEAHRRAGFPAVEARATDMRAVPEGTADVVHSRFVLSWLTDTDIRSQALAEMVRTGKEPMELAVIDYDWSVMEGPEVLMQATEYLLGIMRKNGFDPDYGSQLSEDIPARLAEQCTLPASAVFRTDTYPLPIHTLGEAMVFIESTANAVAATLAQVNMTQSVEAIQDHLERIRAFAQSFPDTPVRMPDIVTLQAQFPEKPRPISEKSLDRHMGHASIEQLFVAGRDYEIVLPESERLGNILQVCSPELVTEARKIQASAYKAAKIIDETAKGQDETLKPHIDPQEQVERSLYLIAINAATISSVVRMIRPAEQQGDSSLPEIQRMQRQSPLAYQLYLDYMKPVSQQRTPRVVEVSALCKEPKSGRLEDVLKSVIVLNEIGRAEGFDYAVMGLEQSNVELFRALFGPEAFVVLDTPDAAHRIELDGVNSDKVFVSCVVGVQAFTDQSLAYADSHRKGRPLHGLIADVAQECIEHRKAT